MVAESTRVRALGTGHSFNRIADTAGELISTAALPPVADIDTAAATVTAGAGVRYGDLAQRLNAAGWALPNLASLPHISVAGACATATHGSGDRNRNLAAAVRAVDLVTADGSLLTLDRDADRQRFPGAVVSLGALGVVTTLTLDLVPAFAVRQYVYEDLPAGQLTGHFDEIMGAAYSVSVFTRWQGGRHDQVWLKHRGRRPGNLPRGPALARRPPRRRAPAPGARHARGHDHAAGRRARPVARAAPPLPARVHPEQRRRNSRPSTCSPGRPRSPRSRRCPASASCSPRCCRYRRSARSPRTRRG